MCVSVVLTLASCSQEENLMDKVLTNVDNTRWLATHGSESYELIFKNGMYTFTHYGNHSVTGTYTQNKLDIQFEEKRIITYTVLILKSGKISQSSIMEIPMYYDPNFSDETIAYTLKFTPVEYLKK